MNASFVTTTVITQLFTNLHKERYPGVPSHSCEWHAQWPGLKMGNVSLLLFQKYLPVQRDSSICVGPVEMRWRTNRRKALVFPFLVWSKRKLVLKTNLLFPVLGGNTHQMFLMLDGQLLFSESTPGHSLRKSICTDIQILLFEVMYNV